MNMEKTSERRNGLAFFSNGARCFHFIQQPTSWDIENMSRKKFLRNRRSQYTHHMVRAQFKSSGFFEVSCSVDRDVQTIGHLVQCQARRHSIEDLGFPPREGLGFAWRQFSPPAQLRKKRESSGMFMWWIAGPRSTPRASYLGRSERHQ